MDYEKMIRNEEEIEKDKETHENETSIDKTQLKSELTFEEMLKLKYNKLYKVKTENEVLDENFIYYFKKPSIMSFNRAIKAMSKRTLQSMTDFISDNIVEEQRKELMEDIENYPAIAINIGQKLMALLGLSDDIEIKKL